VIDSRAGTYLKDFFKILILALVYFVSAKLGLQLAFVHESATAVWPPTGIAIATLLILGRRFWPGIFLGAFAANVTTAGTVATSLGIATGNTLEAVVAVLLVNTYARGRQAFDQPGDIVKFIVFAGIVGPIISATVGVSSLLLGGFVLPESFLSVWVTWFLGDFGGALVFAPFLVVWANDPVIRWKRQQWVEAILLLIVLLVTTELIFGTAGTAPLAFMLFPVLLWVVFRFGVREVVTAAFIISVIAIGHTLRGSGPFARASTNESLLLLQLFLVVITTTKVIVGSVVSKRQELDRLKSEFVSIASHELRTPMTAIDGFLDMIKDGLYGPVQKSLMEPLEYISRSTEHLIHLVDDMLHVSRMEAGRIKVTVTDVALAPLITEVVTGMVPLAKERDVALVAESLVNDRVQADPDKVKEILNNLLGNALKFIVEGSITVSSQRAGDVVTIFVADTGVGIAPKDIAKLFSKFQQIPYPKGGKPPGTGLGLYISQGFARMMGGDLWLVKSEVGKGSTFAFSLPVAGSDLARTIQEVLSRQSPRSAYIPSSD
jgi:signal transduction histidine kinase